VILEVLHIENRRAQLFGGLLGPDEPAKFDKGHDIATVGTPRMFGGASIDPGLEDGGDGIEKRFDALFYLWRVRARNHLRQCR
jgi:hypothetical protein